jgi:acyl-CoA synthetase (AMP-forming)/AMP-acid ligase II
MAVELTRPFAASETRARRESGAWADRVEVDVDLLRSHGGRLALVDRRGRSTYAELADRVEEAAGGLAALGVGRRDAVVVIADNDRDSIVATYAVWRLGAVALLVHVSSGTADVAFACRVASPAAALYSAGSAALRGASAGTPTFLIDELPAGTAPPAADLEPDAPRLVVLTSGTTSTPKGVVHTANTLRASQANYRAMTDLTPDERFFVVSPLASMAGVLQVLELAPRLGAAAILESAWEPTSTLRFLVDQGATFYGGTDNVLARLFEVARPMGIALPLRAAAVGGTMLRRDVLDEAEERHGITVVRVYGSSEAPCSTGAHPSEPHDVRVGDDGAPMPGVEVRLSDDSEELIVRGPHLFGGYLDPKDNEGVFVDDGWFRTGDAADITSGRVRVVGRLKEIANRNGRKMSLAEVEEAFRAAAPVDDCTAFVQPDATTGERVAVAVTGGGDFDVPSVLNAMVAAGLPRWKLPESVVRHEGPLPRTATGKVQRRLLSDDGGVLWRAERLRDPS